MSPEQVAGRSAGARHSQRCIRARRHPLRTAGGAAAVQHRAEASCTKSCTRFAKKTRFRSSSIQPHLSRRRRDHRREGAGEGKDAPLCVGGGSGRRSSGVYLDDEPIVARPPSTSYQLQKFARRHKALVTGVAAVFVVLGRRGRAEHVASGARATGRATAERAVRASHQRFSAERSARSGERRHPVRSRAPNPIRT